MKVHRIKEQIEVYKSKLRGKSDSYDMFPFEALLNYKQHWDLEASDFSEMFDKSFKSEISNTLWSADQYHPKKLMLRFIEMDKEFVRLMFRDLFTEDKDIVLRVNRFIYYCDEMLSSLMKLDRKESSHYHGDLRMVTTYLAMEFPDKYTVYNFKMFKSLMMRLESQKIPVVDEIARFQTLMKSLYHNFMLKDQELVDTMSKMTKENSFFAGESTMWVLHFATAIGAIRQK